jgi:hypothetical protein
MAKPKKGSDKPLYYYKGENGKLIPVKGTVKWKDLSAKDKKKVTGTVVKGTAGAVTRGGMAALPYGKVVKGAKAIVKDVANKKATAKFMKDLKKNGVAVKKVPNSPFAGITNSASARSERARAIRSGKVVDINKKRKGR